MDKSILYGKEKRKPYRGAKAIDPWCRNHGADEWALENRQYKNIKRKMSADEQLEDY